MANDATARILNALLVGVLCFYVFDVGIIIPFFALHKLTSAAQASCAGLLFAVALALLYGGSLRAASLVYLCGAWLLATVVTVLNGGIHSPGIVFYVALPISAAWLLGYQAAFLSAGMCLAASLAMAVLEQNGRPLPLYLPGRPLGIWAMIVVAMIIAAVPVARVLKILKEALAQSEAAKEEALASQKLETIGQLARGIAHDFNNLLGGILATAELALAQHAEGSLPKEELHTIRTAAIRGAEIVRQLMTYGGEETVAFEAVDLPLLVQEMVQLLKVSVSKHAILETILAESAPPVSANPAQIRQIVMNLVKNASEAIGERPGTIRVAIAPVNVGPYARAAGDTGLSAGDYLKLEVSDTGGGMSPEVKARIFDPFFTTKSDGHGLGLAAVRGIVRSHRGAINVVSALGQGTRFEVLLPCADHASPEIRAVHHTATE